MVIRRLLLAILVCSHVAIPIVSAAGKGEEFTLPGVDLNRWAPKHTNKFSQRKYYDRARGWVLETCEIDRSELRKCTEIWRSNDRTFRRNVGGIIRPK
jgi:hypothetical protein